MKKTFSKVAVLVLALAMIISAMPVMAEETVSYPALSTPYTETFNWVGDTWVDPNTADSFTLVEQIGEYDPSEIMIVGDSLTSDIQGGNNAGIVCCWYNPSGKLNDKSLRIDYEITDLQDILKLI
jgi:phosphoglycolate phosphatase-like HAD superfamily hydrolase